MASKQTQIIDEYDYNTENMMFADPQKNTIPESMPPISYTKVNIFTKNRNGTYGDLIIQAPTCYSFGVSESADQKTKIVNNYSLPLALWSKEGPLAEEKKFTDMIERITDKVREYLLKNKKQIGKADLTQHSDSITKLCPLYWKKNEEGERIEGSGPTLYPKLLQSKKDPNNIVIYTKFNDLKTDAEMDPKALVQKHFRVIPAIKLESIYIGSKISLQLKVIECLVELVEAGPKRLLKRPTPVPMVSGIDTSSVQMDKAQTTVSEDAIPGSLENSEDESHTASATKTSPAEIVINTESNSGKKVVRRPTKRP